MARQVTIQVDGAGEPFAPGDDFLRFSLTQRLAGHHSFALTVPYDRAEDSKTAFFSHTLEKLLGETIVVSIDDAIVMQGTKKQQLLFKGIITGLSTSKDTDYSASITVQGYSPCRQLADGLQKRTFVKQTLADIFRDVLAPYPEDLLPRQIQPEHRAPLPYVVQYQESNYAFLSRLAAEYGEWFYYDGQKLHLGPAAAGEAFDFVADGVYNNFQFNLSLQPTRVTLYDYNYQQHEHFTSHTTAQQLPALSQHRYSKLASDQSEKLFAQASHTTAETVIQSASQLNEEAKFLKAHRVANLVVMQGHSDNSSLLLGGVIRIHGEGLGSQHLTDESFGTYRITELTHHVSAAGNYQNTFTAIPHLLEVPPVYPTYAPPAGTSELAEVIDTKDPEHLGRIRVRFYWPVEKPRNAETDWLRVLTPYAGAGKGQLFTPEVGSQVLIGYQSGLAEQPYVQGNLFHAKNKANAKYTHNGGEIKGIQTMAGNRVTFHDKKGAEKIVITNGNQKSTALEIGFTGDGNITLKTNGSISLAAGKDVVIEAGNDVKISAKKNVVVTAKEENMHLTAKKGASLKAKDLDLDVSNNMQAQVSSNLTMKAGGQAKLVSTDTDVI
ncbi:type VI secretion system Vgr family protein [Hymenobacter terrenus]|uniref:type VI secretion system Vgr family protein n=1 Tax=Hymenobacter terrenus TaxID=1629124 RepID=UPI0006197899|nr:contractile injection system protein, VgrG/Pvc8 family [Hymenobacter terrenus]